MKRYAITIVFTLIACNASAQEQRIRDYSLSPTESLQLPNTTHGNNPYVQFPNQGGFNSGGNNTQLGNGTAMTPANRFMDGYCDPNFNPRIAGNTKVAGMQACLAQQKQQQCETFRSLPADVQRVLDDTANCLFTASNADEPSTAKTPDCTANDSLRMQLLRKYGQNQAVAQALETLPEDIMNASNKCMGGNR